MPLNIGEILLGALSPALQSVVTDKMGVIFDKLYAHDPEGHTATLKSLYIGMGQVERLTDETKTKIDDAVVDAITAAIEASAEKYEVELSV